MKVERFEIGVSNLGADYTRQFSVQNPKSGVFQEVGVTHPTEANSGTTAKSSKWSLEKVA